MSDVNLFSLLLQETIFRAFLYLSILHVALRVQRFTSSLCIIFSLKPPSHLTKPFSY